MDERCSCTISFTSFPLSFFFFCFFFLPLSPLYPSYCSLTPYITLGAKLVSAVVPNLDFVVANDIGEVRFFYCLGLLLLSCSC